ncbi:MAG: cytidylyltransferase domain-containing protein [Candidatus Methylomirabilales bacterium]
MKVGAIVQARMNSERLPGKVLHTVRGKPMLEYLLERLDHCKSLDAVVVATSTDPTDDPVARFCRQGARQCFRGSLDNVASRFKDVLDTSKLDAFVRISGDSPLLDPKVVDRGVELFLKGDYDVVTNVFPRSFPRGQSVEVVRAGTFRRAFERAWSEDELQHVTLYFYRHPEWFRILNFGADADYSGVHLAVDTIEDMERFASLVEGMEKSHWEYSLPEILDMCRTVYDPRRSRA